LTNYIYIAHYIHLTPADRAGGKVPLAAGVHEHHSIIGQPSQSLSRHFSISAGLSYASAISLGLLYAVMTNVSVYIDADET